jgi:hypothetical protein
MRLLFHIKKGGKVVKLCGVLEDFWQGFFFF